jgi:cellulose synthase/poly-beta-1,6-N-acetylglucosamine synthase-like glycosyltransferase
MSARRPPPGPTVICRNCRWHGSAAAAYCRRCGTPNPRHAEQAEAAARPLRIATTAAPTATRRDARKEGESWSLVAPLSAMRSALVDAGELLAPTVSCSGCGRSMSAAARHCHRCGARRRGRLWRPTVGAPGADLSAARTLSRRQRTVLIGVAGVLVVLIVLAPLATVTLAIGVATAFYLASLVYRLLMFRAALEAPENVVVSDAEARAISGRRLPMYTVLVPAYREPEVIAGLLESLSRLEYPAHRLDIKLLLEADDPATLEAVVQAEPGANVEVVRILPSEPRTKPKACNVGLGRARGRFVTVYDAEDRPDPLQLRRAVAAFWRLPSDVACLQAKLSYHNADQNLITRWFTAEYALWFGQWLPGLVKLGAPLPLGGTSNHFRRETLVRVGGWDSFNVTEDADLGIRLHRLGFRTRVLDSVTFEEANSDFVNWAKQRSRWYKGYLQTWLVHMRHPRRLARQLGVPGFIGFNLFVGGTPMLALINPVFWALTALWFLAKPGVILELFPPWLYYTGMVSLVLGNFTFIYTAVVGARVAGRPGLVFAALLSPIYWIMMSIAAIKAMAQLLAAPAFWEKTVHGLDGARTVSDRDHVAA